jgi:hypothetical protein
VQHSLRDVPIEQSARECGTVHSSFDCAVADDQRNRRGQRGRDRSSEGIAAASDEGDMNTCVNRRMNRSAILIRQLSLAVEQRAVHVNANQSDHAQFCSLQHSRVRLKPDTTAVGRVG